MRVSDMSKSAGDARASQTRVASDFPRLVLNRDAGISNLGDEFPCQVTRRHPPGFANVVMSTWSPGGNFRAFFCVSVERTLKLFAHPVRFSTAMLGAISRAAEVGVIRAKRPIEFARWDMFSSAKETFHDVTSNLGAPGARPHLSGNRGPGVVIGENHSRLANAGPGTYASACPVQTSSNA